MGRKMKRLVIYTFTALCLYSVFVNTPLCANSEKDRAILNVVLITLDTTRADHLGCYGYTRNTTPHIDRFSKEAALFSHAVSVIPLTTPSHASIMTGLHPENHQIYKNSYPVHESFTMLAEILKRKGYATGGFVSVKIIDSRVGFAQGFDYFSDVPTTPHGNDNDGDDQKKRIRKRLFEPLLQRRGDRTVDVGLEWLQENQDQPFFAWVHLYDPHLSYTPPPEYGYRFNTHYEEYLQSIRNPFFKKKAYEDQTVYKGAEKKEGEPISTKEAFQLLLDIFGIRAREFLLSDSTPPNLVDDFIAAYDGELAFVDEQVARIIFFLKDNNVYKNTIVIIMGDHGEILYEKEEYFGHHKYLYQGSMRIPLIMKFPGIAHRKINERITNVDILPTLLEALGIEVAIAMDGVSYWPVISSYGTVQRPEQLFYGTHTGQRRASEEHKLQELPSSIRKIRNVSMKIYKFIKRVFMRVLHIKQRWKIEDHFDKIAVVKGDWKLIRSESSMSKKDIIYELYNLREDPDEMENLIDREEEVYNELRRLLKKYIKTKRFSVAPQQHDGQTEEEIKTLRSLGYM
jgi:arylsulfatase